MTRHEVMIAFGAYLDYCEWLGRVKRGVEDPPEGGTISDLAATVMMLEREYKRALAEYIERETK